MPNRAILLLLCVFFPLLPAVAGEYRIVSAPEVRQLMENNDALLVNSLSRIEHEIQHIPGSVSIPVNEVGESAALPEDKLAPVIFYCMGSKCPHSERSAIKAVELGYKRVYWFRGGIPEWYQFGYPMQINKEMLDIHVEMMNPVELAAYMETEAPYVLDVRPRDWKHSDQYLHGTVAIPLVELDRKVGHIPRQRPLVITDGLMKQSVSAARYLLANGYRVAGVLKGGIMRWKREGFPVVRADDVQFP